MGWRTTSRIGMGRRASARTGVWRADPASWERVWRSSPAGASTHGHEPGTSVSLVW